MQSSLRPILVGAATVAIATAIAAGFALAQHGRTGELPAFLVWSVPLGLATTLFARRPRFAGVPLPLRALATAGAGLAMGFALTVLGWGLLGGWMLAWDFPVFYCWTIAAVCGSLLAARTHQVVPAWQLPVGGAIAGGLLLLMAWLASRPSPALLVLYQDLPGRDVAEEVHDSVLTQPHSSGTGRDLRWDARMYARIGTVDGHTAVLLQFDRTADRDSARATLLRDPRVLTARDSALSR